MKTAKKEKKSVQSQAVAQELQCVLTRGDDNTITLKITVPWERVEKTRKSVEDELIKHVTVAGFRKGSAPADIARAKLSKDTVQEEMLKRLLTETYNEAIKKEQINPVISPQIHVETFDEGTALTYTAVTCEAPAVDLKNYKEAVRKATAASKIIVPGKNGSAGSEQNKSSLDEAVKAALESSDVKIPKIIIQQESTRLLSQLLDELKKLGISLDQYLASRNKDAETLKDEYEKKAYNDLKLEFVLRKIADEEKITVEPHDIETALKSIEDPKEKAAVSQNPYLVAAIIRQQKTLEFISKI